ncbi:MAG: hypothetical protein A2X94_01490 [Bdellovibrionales bacterium GWB1_55_8]|nr:MAG: hypothetical protein A2X94_01490 [Bdellovibrionales bacterium GWB1_55_8]
MKKLLLVLLAITLSGTQAFAGQCAESYLQSGMEIQQNRGFGFLIKGIYDYDETMKFFDQDHFKAITTLAVLGVAFPFLVIVDGTQSAFDAHEARYLLKVGEALSATGSKRARKGLRAMYRLVKSEIEITPQEFEKAIASLGTRNTLCKNDLQIQLTEKGRERVGDAGFFAYLNRIHGTPEWDEFWNDPQNFQTIWGPAPLVKKELKRALLHALVAEGYPRR